MKNVIATTILTLLGLAATQPVFNNAANGTLSSNYTVPLKTGTPSFDLTYTVDSRYTPAVVNFQLLVKGFSVSTWGTAGTAGHGMFVGIGFGTTEMSHADIVICSYNFTNKASDAFSCGDVKTDGNNVPYPDSSQDIYNVTTVVGVGARTTSSAAAANFGVKFSRPMRTNDTGNDYQLNNRDEDIIYALGYYINNVPQQHTSGNFGSAKLNLTMAPNYQDSSAFRSIAAFCSYITLFTLFVLNF